MSGWITERADAYCDSVRDGTHDSPKQVERGHRLITSKHIANETLNFAGANFISDEDYEAINQRSKVDVGDLLFSMIGTVGRVYRVDDEPDYAIKNMGLFKISDELKSKYLFYYMQSPTARQYIEGCLAGSTQKFMSLTSLRAFPIVYPNDHTTMAAIVEILDSLTWKHRINQRTNDYLAAIAEGVFEDWLLTAEGEPTPLSRFASFNPSTYSPKEKWPVVAYVDTGSVTRNHFDKPMVIDTATEKLPSRARRKVEDGDVIYSTVRPNQLHYGLVCNPPSNMLVSTGFTVARDSVGVGGPFIYLALTRPSITAKLQSVAEQSTSAYPSIKSSDLEQLEIPMPTKDEIEEIKPQLDSLFAAIAHNEYESKMLEELRDTLLPKLMSGEIDVSQIELPMQPNNHLSV